MLDEILKGIEKVNNLVKVTLGIKRRNVLIDKLNGLLITNDGVTIVNNVNLTNPYEMIGLELCKIVSNQVNDLVKDGTTQSIILFYEILKRGNELIKEGITPSELIEHLENTLEKFLSKIDEYKETIYKDELNKVLTTTTDKPKIIDKVCEAYQLIEEKGIINLKKTIGEDYITHQKGYFVYSKLKIKDCIKRCKIILINDTLNNLYNLKAYLDQNILIITKETTMDIINYLKAKQAQIIILYHSDSEINEIFEDLEELLKIKCSYQDIYLTNEIEIEIKNNVIFFEVNECESLIKKLNDQLRDTKSNLTKIRLKERIAKLTNGIVNIYVGGSSEEIIDHKVLIYEDAINTAYHALTNGVVKGGGYIYFLLLEELDNIYIDVIPTAIKKLIFQLLKNSDTTIEKVYKFLNKDRWYNFNTNQLIDIKDFKVYDAVDTVKTILKVTIENACLLFNTTDIIINKQTINNEINDLI